MGILCLFIGSTLMWVAAHGTSATSPWTLFQQIVAGWSGQAATAAPAAGDSEPDGTAINAGDSASSSDVPSDSQLSALKQGNGFGIAGAGFAQAGAAVALQGEDPFAGTGFGQ